MPQHIAILCLGILAAVSSVETGMASDTDFSGQIRKPVREAVNIRQSTQQEEQQWRDGKYKLLAIYDELQQEQKKLQGRKDQLQYDIAAVRDRIAGKEKQLEDIRQISAQIMPFLKDLAGRLQQLVSEDLPFLTSERRLRLARLTDLMEDPEVPVSEKFRKAMEALLVEAEYGSTIEVYQQTIAVVGAPSLVNVFRLGRLSLFYQTLDRKRCGFYDVAAAGWRPLPAVFNRSIQSAVEIGAKRRPVELLTLPLGRMAD